jgi:hypothetical protein
MRMNLSAHALPSRGLNPNESSVILTIKPSCSLPGDYSYTTNRESLLRILRQTDLPSTVLERFSDSLYEAKGASLLAVELSEKTLMDIGYFVD